MANALSSLNLRADTASSVLEQGYSIRSTSSSKMIQSIRFDGIDAYTNIQAAIVLGNEALLDSLLKAGQTQKSLVLMV
jgi:hypothetical protein